MHTCLHLRQSAEVDNVRDIYSSYISQTSWSDCGSEARVPPALPLQCWEWLWFRAII